jgi:probable rRNA maturation factor
MANPAHSLVCRVHRRCRLVPAKAAEVRRVVRHVCGAQGPAAGEVDVAVIDDAAIAALAGRFGHPRRPTDVLSFLLSEPAEPPVIQIAVSAETAARQAAARGHDPAAELMLYVVHGLLHQCGFDDGDAGEAAAMHAREDELLCELGFGKVFGRNRAPGTGPKART